ncbi:MAG: NAD(P)-dependent oxidoreductase [Isosphaeraceae bacterium]
MAVWLVTGGSGFVGRHVLQALSSGSGFGDVVAAGRRCPPGWDPRGYVATDLDDPLTIARAVQAVDPDVVIHTAGRTPPASFEELDHANVRATLNLLGVLARLRRPVRVVLLGSAAELGDVEEAHLPVNEDHECRPRTAYGWSKRLSTLAGQLVPPPLEVVIARLFNPIGPGLRENQALGHFVRHLLDPASGPLVVGDLDVRRDFIDVRDVARALVALAWSGRSGQVYHVGTGRSHRVGDGLNRLIRRSGRTVEIRVDPGRAALAGPRDSRADTTRIQSETGWSPRISWEQSLDDLWDDAAGQARAALPLTA